MLLMKHARVATKGLLKAVARHTVFARTLLMISALAPTPVIQLLQLRKASHCECAVTAEQTQDQETNGNDSSSGGSAGVPSGGLAGTLHRMSSTLMVSLPLFFSQALLQCKHLL